MRILLSVVSTFGFLTIVSGQVIENRMSFRLGLLHGTFSGDSVINENGFITPSLFPQLKGPSGISAAATYKLISVVSLGLGAELQYGYGWAMQSARDFDGANVLASSVYPFVQLHTPVVSTGLFNKLELTGGIGYFTGRINFKMEHYDFEIIGPNYEYLSDWTKRRIRESRSVSELRSWQGLRVDYGLRYAVNDRIGFYIHAWNLFGKVDASFYSDKQVNANGAGIGLIYSILKVKRIGY
jgi:hypothetical protein